MHKIFKVAGAILISVLSLNYAVAQPAKPGNKESEKPNVLFIIADDLNTALGCYGNKIVKTPNIDRLANRAIRFDRAYCQATLCSPSRTSMLTGLRPEHNGVFWNRARFRDIVPDVVTLPQYFRRNNYFTARVGKVFHYTVPADIGTDGKDDPISWNKVVNPKGRDVTDAAQIMGLPAGTKSQTYLPAQGADEGQTDGMTATEAIKIIKENKDKPFFVAVGFFRPHLPMVAPRKYFDMYDLSAIPLPKNIAHDRSAKPEYSLTINPADYGMTDNERREAIRAYYASISFMDAQAGRLLDELDRLNLTKNTIIVFWGDHGLHLSEHGLWLKNTLYEQTARVPLLISSPWNKKAMFAAGIVEAIDIYPTLTELCGLPAVKANDGKSLVPLLLNPGQPGKQAAFTLSQKSPNKGSDMGKSIRTDRWRYIEWEEGKKGMELYDHSNDPEEYVNLAGVEKYQDVIKNLQKQLRALKSPIEKARLRL